MLAYRCRRRAPPPCAEDLQSLKPRCINLQTFRMSGLLIMSAILAEITWEPVKEEVQTAAGPVERVVLKPVVHAEDGCVDDPLRTLQGPWTRLVFHILVEGRVDGNLKKRVWQALWRAMKHKLVKLPDLLEKSQYFLNLPCRRDRGGFGIMFGTILQATFPAQEDVGITYSEPMSCDSCGRSCFTLGMSFSRSICCDGREH
jgi:hypothetical protein